MEDALDSALSQAVAAVAAARAAPLSVKKAWLAALLVDAAADALFTARRGGQGEDLLAFRADLAAQCAALALAFGVGHNGCPVYEAGKKPGFFRLQTLTTRNIVDTPLAAWFMGGLHYQMEHHLFPSMPHSNLSKVAPRVRALCERHGVPYRCTGFWEGTAEVLRHLHDVSLDLSGATTKAD